MRQKIFLVLKNNIVTAVKLEYILHLKAENSLNYYVVLRPKNNQPYILAEDNFGISRFAEASEVLNQRRKKIYVHENYDKIVCS